MKSHNELLPDPLEEKAVLYVTEGRGEYQAGDPFLVALLDEVERDARAQAAEESSRVVQPGGSVFTSGKPVSEPASLTRLDRVRYGLD
ncbi:MAG: hypothetical protein KC643_13190 [Nitrospira sp.]|nr:hypothetical protein [Nitrospira sp.]